MEITTTHLSLGAHWAAHGLRFCGATRDVRTGQVTLAFHDDDGRGTALAGTYTLDEKSQRYSVWRGRLAGVIRPSALDEATMSADEFEVRVPR